MLQVGPLRQKIKADPERPQFCTGGNVHRLSLARSGLDQVADSELSHGQRNYLFSNGGSHGTKILQEGIERCQARDEEA
jgi:hypothetical protein